MTIILRSSCKECGKIFETKSNNRMNRMISRNIHEIKIACHYLKTHKKMKTRAILLLFAPALQVMKLRNKLPLNFTNKLEALH